MRMSSSSRIWAAAVRRFGCSVMSLNTSSPPEYGYCPPSSPCSAAAAVAAATRSCGNRPSSRSSPDSCQRLICAGESTAPSLAGSAPPSGKATRSGARNFVDGLKCQRPGTGGHSSLSLLSSAIGMALPPSRSSSIRSDNAAATAAPVAPAAAALSCRSASSRHASAYGVMSMPSGLLSGSWCPP